MADNHDTMLRPAEMCRWRGAEHAVETDLVVVEEPLEIRLNDRAIAITLRTPGQDDALAVGFLATESMLESPADVWDVLRCPDPDAPQTGNIINVCTDPSRITREAHTLGGRYSTSSCGLCGRAAIEQVIRYCPPLTNRRVVSRSVVCRLPGALRKAQPVFSRTGGLHAAGLFNLQGTLLFAAEDVGRHNAADKVIGQALLANHWPLEETILAVSGRAGFEIVQKALTVRIAAVCAVSAPSTLSMELARAGGMILVGFLRGDSMNVYAGADRLIP